MWNRRGWLAVIALCAIEAAPAPAWADAEAGIRFLYQHSSSNQGGAFTVPEGYRVLPGKLGQQDAYLRWQEPYFKFNGRATAREGLDCCGSCQEGVVNELYANIALSPAIGASIGKKVASWGIGQAFRPLDVLQRENRQAVEPLDLEGVPMAMLEYFGESSALTIVAANRSWLSGGGQRDETEGGVKYTALAGGTDVQLVGYIKEASELSLGAGAANVFGDSLEAHASFNYLASYAKPRHSLAGQSPALLNTANPFTDKKMDNGVQLLVGGSWTWESRVSLMMEAWHDDTAFTKDEWLGILELTRSQRAMLGLGVPADAVYGNVNGNSRFYQRPNLLQDTIMIRLAYDGGYFKPELYILNTPLDGGLLITAAAEYRAWDGVYLFGAARFLTGMANSAYAESANSGLFYAGIRIEGAILQAD